jgi:hypothetical protein
MNKVSLLNSIAIFSIFSIAHVQCMEEKIGEHGPSFIITTTNNMKEQIRILALQKYHPAYLDNRCEHCFKEEDICTLEPKQQCTSKPMKVALKLWNTTEGKKRLFYDCVNLSVYPAKTKGDNSLGFMKIGEDIEKSQFLIRSLIKSEKYKLLGGGYQEIVQTFPTPADDKTVTIEVGLNGKDSLEEIKILRLMHEKK